MMVERGGGEIMKVRVQEEKKNEEVEISGECGEKELRYVSMLNVNILFSPLKS